MSRRRSKLTCWLLAALRSQPAALSGWVNDALRRQADHDRRMVALDDFLSAYESEHGEITEREMDEATRRARTRAVIVRGASNDTERHDQGVA